MSRDIKTGPSDPYRVRIRSCIYDIYNVLSGRSQRTAGSPVDCSTRSCLSRCALTVR